MRCSRSSIEVWSASSKGICIKRTRLDTELVRRGLADSRSEARRVIEEGGVVVQGAPTPGPATLVTPEVSIKVRSRDRFVSRGGVKLDGALAELDVEVAGRRWLDAGASTGGFTDRLLKGGAGAVVAVDVGYGQLDWGLRNDERVTVLERTNVRSLAEVGLPWTPDAVVADLSFISLRLVLPALAAVVAESGTMLLMVKPQFEVGRGAVGKGGVVRDPALWIAAIEGVVDAASSLGWELAGTAPSRLPGPSGNREFFVRLERGIEADRASIVRSVTEASS